MPIESFHSLHDGAYVDRNTLLMCCGIPSNAHPCRRADGRPQLAQEELIPYLSPKVRVSHYMPSASSRHVTITSLTRGEAIFILIASLHDVAIVLNQVLQCPAMPNPGFVDDVSKLFRQHVRRYLLRLLRDLLPKVSLFLLCDVLSIHVDQTCTIREMVFVCQSLCVEHMTSTEETWGDETDEDDGEGNADTIVTGADDGVPLSTALPSLGENFGRLAAGTSRQAAKFGTTGSSCIFLLLQLTVALMSPQVQVASLEAAAVVALRRGVTLASASVDARVASLRYVPPVPVVGRVENGDAPTMELRTRRPNKRRRVEVTLPAVASEGRTRLQLHPPPTPPSPIRRCSGIRELPIEVQREILDFLAPRYLAAASTVCYVWNVLVSTHPGSLKQKLHVSRVLRRTYTNFMVEDWGEKQLALWSWSSLLPLLHWLDINDGRRPSGEVILWLLELTMEGVVLRIVGGVKKHFVHLSDERRKMFPDIILAEMLRSISTLCAAFLSLGRFPPAPPPFF